MAPKIRAGSAGPGARALRAAAKARIARGCKDAGTKMLLDRGERAVAKALADIQPLLRGQAVRTPSVCTLPRQGHA
jgi:hypothetical protein